MEINTNVKLLQKIYNTRNKYRMQSLKILSVHVFLCINKGTEILNKLKKITNKRCKQPIEFLGSNELV